MSISSDAVIRVDFNGKSYTIELNKETIVPDILKSLPFKTDVRNSDLLYQGEPLNVNDPIINQGVNPNDELQLYIETHNLKFGDGEPLQIPYKGEKTLIDLICESEEFVKNLKAFELQCKFSDVNVVDKHGDTPLLYVIRNKENVEILIQHGANINAQNKITSCALIRASIKGDVEIVELLLQNKADIEASTIFGTTALMHASKAGHFKTVKLLLQYGANVHNTDNIDFNALNHARIENRTEIVKLLRNHMQSH